MIHSLEIGKEALKRYQIMVQEIETLRADIIKCEDSIAKIVETGTVKDRVYGGEGGIQGFNIEGFPVALYNKRLSTLRKLQNLLIMKETDLTELAITIEQYLDTITDPRDRMIFRYVYMQGLTQEEAARRLYIDQSVVSRTITRYMQDA